jgi:hypothetical protein
MRKFAFRDSDSFPIVVEGGNDVFDKELGSLAEGKTKIVNGIPVRKDKPHSNGDDYHATIVFDDRTEASWYKTSGKRRHPNKFPANISAAHKAAAAKVLGKHPDQLEAFEVRDEETGERYLLIEEKGALTQLVETIEKVRGGSE